MRLSARVRTSIVLCAYIFLIATPCLPSPVSAAPSLNFSGESEMSNAEKNAYLSAAFYEDNHGVLQRVNTAFIEEQYTYKMDAANYALSVEKQNGSFSYTHKGHGLTLAPVSEKKVIAEQTTQSAFDVSDNTYTVGNTLVYAGLLDTEIDYGLIAKGNLISKIVRLNEKPNLSGDVYPISFDLSLHKGTTLTINGELFTGETTTTEKEVIIRGQDGSISTILSASVWDSAGNETVVPLQFSTGNNGNITLTKLVPASFLETAIYPVFTDADIAFNGSATVFESASTQEVDITPLSSSKVVIAYQDAGNSSYGTAIVGSISGDSISFNGSATVFLSQITSYISVTAMDSSTVVIAYQDGSTAYGAAIVGSISGDSISFNGSQTDFQENGSSYISVDAISSSKVVIAYRNAGTGFHGTAIVGTVSGDSISFGSATTFESAHSAIMAVAALDSSTVAIAYQDVDNSGYGTAIVGDISGTSISFNGSATVFESASTSAISIDNLDSSTVVVSYSDGGNSSYGTAIVGDITGSAIAFNGSATVFESASTTFTDTVSLDSSNVVMTYKDAGNSSYGTAIVGTVSGDSISFGSATVFESAGTEYTTVAALDGTTVATAYRDSGNSGYGTGIVGSVTLPAGGGDAVPEFSTWSLLLLLAAVAYYIHKEDLFPTLSA